MSTEHTCEYCQEPVMGAGSVHAACEREAWQALSAREADEAENEAVRDALKTIRAFTQDQLNEERHDTLGFLLDCYDDVASRSLESLEKEWEERSHEVWLESDDYEEKRDADAAMIAVTQRLGAVIAKIDELLPW